MVVVAGTGVQMFENLKGGIISERLAATGKYNLESPGKAGRIETEYDISASGLYCFVNLLGKKINAINKNTEALSDYSMSSKHREN
jgi:hypothetical protein